MRDLLQFRPSPVKLGAGILLFVAVLAVPFIIFTDASAVQLGFRSLQLSDGTNGVGGVTYKFGFNVNTSAPIGSIRYEVCSNYQYEPGDPCTAPTGFDASAATLSDQTGVTDFSLHGDSTGNVLIIARPAAVNAAPQPLTYSFSNIQNPDDVGSNFVRISTYASLDGTGAEIDFGVVVFATNIGVSITTEVPPYLLFCTGITIDGYNCGTAEGSFINFGELSSKATRSATSQMLASTNAPYGYSVTLAGATMTAGTNVIPAMTGGSSAVGTSQFGINGRSNGSPGVGREPDGPGLTMPTAAYNTPNNFRFASGDIIASSNTTDDYRKMTVSYIVNVSGNQPAGRYVATVSYICLANF
ncbi:MAG TPA: hypothetical protein VF572_02920 [Candidatus Saccharimonadales bacterium]